VNIGSPSNACQAQWKTKGSPGVDPCPELERHAGIWRWRSDILGQSFDDGEHYAIGIRNTIAQSWDETYGALFVVQMGRDRLDSLWPETFTVEQNAALPAEEFFRVEQGREYGWPYCYYDPFLEKKVLAPEYGGDGKTVGRCERYEKPLMTFPAHFSPSSIAFYHARAFPKQYHGGAFVALKGSWNRAPLPQDGYIVAFVPFADGVPTGDWETFADGFKGFDILYERDNAVYRPQSIAVHPDGSLYILDNIEGRIWRIDYTGVQRDVARPETREPTSDRALLVQASKGKGAELYAQYCASCHQPGGGGVPGEFPPLTDTDWVSGDKGRLIRAVLHGMEGPVMINGALYDEIMPGHDFLSDNDLAALLTYVRATFADAGPIHDSEVLLVRNGDNREGRWPASELETMLGVPGVDQTP
jgi:mono/diheme cytochrome c family protein